MSLIVTGKSESLVYLHKRHFELCECLVCLSNLLCQGRLISGGKIKVYDLVCEAGELVAEAEVVLTSVCCREINRVILLPLFLVDDSVPRSKQSHVHIKIPSSCHLMKKTSVYGISYTCLVYGAPYLEIVLYKALKLYIYVSSFELL